MTDYPGMFKTYQLQGSDWVRRLSPEDRRIWASLGRMKLSMLNKNWHALGGQTRAVAPLSPA